MHVQKVKEQEKAYNKQVHVYHSFIYLFLINHFNLSLTTEPLYVYLCPPWLAPAWGVEGYFWEFLVWVCRPVIQILTLFQTKECHFPHPFSDVGWVVQSVVKITLG